MIETIIKFIGKERFPFTTNATIFIKLLNISDSKPYFQTNRNSFHSLLRQYFGWLAKDFCFMKIGQIYTFREHNTIFCILILFQLKYLNHCILFLSVSEANAKIFSLTSCHSMKINNLNYCLSLFRCKSVLHVLQNLQAIPRSHQA